MQGPLLDESEELYRPITLARWWSEKHQRVSSAAFDYEVFSVDRVHLTTPAKSAGQFQGVTKLAHFSVALAKLADFEARDELDPKFPDNDAHAHVYDIGTTPKRKTRARKIAETCAIVSL